jgi:hypothetical protein
VPEEVLNLLPTQQRDWLVHRAEVEQRDLAAVLREVILAGIRRVDFEDAHDYARRTTEELNRRLA